MKLRTKGRIMLMIVIIAVIIIGACAATPVAAQYPTLDAVRAARGGWYGGNSYGSYGRIYAASPGIKFSLNLITEDERELVKRGVVLVNGAEVGIVGRHDSWFNLPVPVAAGEQEVTVVLEDNRVFQTTVNVQPTRVLHVYLRFPPAQPPTEIATAPSAPPAAAPAPEPAPVVSKRFENPYLEAWRPQPLERYPTLQAVARARGK